jgi:hypothetical protein
MFRSFVRTSAFVALFLRVLFLTAPAVAQYRERSVKNPKPPMPQLEPKNAGVQPSPPPRESESRRQPVDQILLEDQRRPHIDRAQILRKKQRNAAAVGEDKTKNDMDALD